MKRKATQSITLIRNKQRVTVAPGEVFDFTDEEVAELEASNPELLSTEASVDLTEEDSKGKKKRTAAAEGADL